MLWGILFGLLSVAASLRGKYLYINGIIEGEVVPQRSTWFIFEVLTIVGFFNQLSSGATTSLIPYVTSVFTVGIILTLSIKKGVGGFKYNDRLVILFTVIGLMIWFVTGNPLHSILATSFVVFISILPTIQKTIKDPMSERLISWRFSLLASMCTTLSVGQLNFELLIIPLTWVVVNTVMILTITTSRRQQISRLNLVRNIRRS